MKKTISFLLVLALTLCMGITVFANNITAEEGTDSNVVKGTYVSGGTVTTIYSVDVVWGSMEFTYTDSFTGTWNPETHTFDNAKEAAWSCSENSNKITVINHSNIPIEADLSYTSKEGYTGIAGTFTNDSIRLSTAEGTSTTAAPTGSSLLTLSGELSSSANLAEIGTVTVTICDSIG